MKHYEERLQQDLTAIQEAVLEVGEMVEEAFRQAVHAILVDDRQLAARLIIGDMPINRRVRDIDALCHAFVAKHLPSAGHLRFVSSVLRIDVALERIGDYAVTLAREHVQLSQPPPEVLARDVELVGEQAADMFHQSMRAFAERDAGLARGTKTMADTMEATFQRIFADLLEASDQQSRPMKDLFALLVVINRIGRVADQAKNLCEETVFIVTGETKEPKVYRVLFIDAKNDALSQMAAAYASKNFPESGRFSSAGWAPAAGVDSRLEVFLERYGFDLSRARTTSLRQLRDQLDDCHVIVSLEGDARQHIDPVPFHTVLLEWDVGPQPGGLDQQRAEALLEEAYKKLSVEIRQLMETLRGPGAT